MDPGANEGVGLRRAYRDIQRFISYAEGTPHRAAGTYAVPREDARARAVDRSHKQSNGGTAADLQRVFGGWRRDRAAGLCELRHSRGLRAARSPGNFSEGCDRHRALRFRLARHETKSGRGAWRDRLHHLFGSARRRIFPGRRLSRGRLAAARRRATRQRDGYGLSRRSAHTWRGRDARCKTPGDQRCQDHYENSRAANFLRRCAAAAFRAARSGGAGKWRGGLGITYHIGPGPAKVHLKVASNWDMKPIYDVIGTLHGGDDAGQWVIRGNHFDAWVNGADDPISGQSEMLEEARMLGELHKHGWTPKRTIIYCAWDGEEPGLLGSVEWVETHLAELQQHAVAYLNSDSNERGPFGAGGTQDLQEVISGVARDVQDPETHLSVFQRAHLVAIGEAKDAEGRAEARKRADLEVSALGDGSDYTAFQDFAGISTLDLGFDGEEDGDQYHSIYDDFYWYTHFVDTDFSYGRALAQTAGTTMLRLAGADLIPVDYAPQAEAIAKYETELEKLLKDKQDEITERNLELQEGVFTAAADPRKTFVPPPVEAVPPYMNFTPMKNSIETLKKSAERYSKALAQWRAAGSPALAPQSLETLNADLLRISRLFLNEKGLPERPWFKNQIYAPGAYTGYGAKTVAAVHEYMDEKKWKEAEAQIPPVAQVIENVAAGINKAAADFETALPSKR